MTISELEQQLAGMELKLYTRDEHYYYVDDLDDNRYAYIDKNGRFVIDTDTDWFKALQTKKRKRLFNILMEFAATPLDKRDTAKYRIKSEYVGCYKNFWVSEYSQEYDDYELSSKFEDAGEFSKEKADVILDMLPDVPMIKNIKELVV